MKPKQLNIALILWRGETPAEQGFKDEMRNLGYQVNYTVFNAEQNKSRINNILRWEINAQEYDYLYTFGTTVSVKTKNIIGRRCKQIFNVVSYPVKAGLVKSMTEPEEYINGVKSDVSLRKQIQNALEVMPFSTLGVLFNPREKNSNLTLEELESLAKEFSFKLVKFRAPPVRNRLNVNLEKIIADDSGVSVVFIPADSYITSNAKFIAEKLNKSKIRTIGANEKLLSEGILLGSVADYYTLGKQAAEIVHANQQGKSLAAIPVETPRPKLVVNSRTMEALGLNIKSSIISTHYLP